MSEYTADELAQSVLVGFTKNRGPAWWAAVGDDLHDNAHFDDAVPWQRVHELFNFEALRADVARVVNGKVQYNADGDIQLVKDTVELYHSVTGQTLGTHGGGYKAHQFSDVLL